MAIEGSLHEMSLPTLMQLVLHDSVQTRIQLYQDGKSGALFVGNARLHHAEVQHNHYHIIGEEAVYELLTWQEGTFIVDRNIPSPTKTIQNSWDFLLMEGLRRHDENQATHIVHEENNLPEILKGLSQSDAAAIQQLVAQQEIKMASKSEQVQAILRNVVQNSSDITGAAVVDRDGLLLASVFNGAVDGNRIAAVSAGLMSLATRSAQQMGQGEVNQTLIQAKEGNIVAMKAGSQASFVALTGTGINLGMVFLECRDAANSIAEVL